MRPLAPKVSALPTGLHPYIMATPMEIEPVTSSVTGWRSTLLNYEVILWWAGMDLNHQCQLRARFTVRCDTNYALPTHMVTMERVELSLRD